MHLFFKTAGRAFPGRARKPLAAFSPMGLFQTILDSVANPNHTGSQGDLQSLAGLAALLPSLQGAERQLQPILDVLGTHVKDSLNQQRETQGGTVTQQT